MTNVTTDPNDSNPGDEAAAKLFVTNLASDLTLRTAWAQLLSQIDSALQGMADGPAKDKMVVEAVQACDNFLVQNGYDTTGTAVLDLLKTPFWEDHLKEDQPNADSDRFVQTLLTDATVYKAWNALLLEVSSGAETIAAIDAYLKRNGYDCTSIQVTASFTKMRNHALSYWSGTYNTTITPISETVTMVGAPPPDNQPKTTALTAPAQVGPTVVILGSDSVTLVGPEFSQTLRRSVAATSAAGLNPGAYAQYFYDNGELTWTAGFSQQVPSVYAGSVTFSEIAQPTKAPTAAPNRFYTPPPASTYTGPIFSGTLTTTVKGNFDPFHGTRVTVTTYSIAAELVPDLSDANNAANIPGGKDHESLLDTLGKWFGYLSIGFMIAKFAWSMGKKFTRTTDFKKASNALDEQIESANTEGATLSGELADTSVSPVANLEFSKSDVLANLDGKLQEATTQGEKDALKAQMDAVTTSEETFDDAPEGEADVEGDGWGGTLGRLVEDMPK